MNDSSANEERAEVVGYSRPGPTPTQEQRALGDQLEEVADLVRAGELTSLGVLVGLPNGVKFIQAGDLNQLNLGLDMMKTVIVANALTPPKRLVEPASAVPSDVAKIVPFRN